LLKCNKTNSFLSFVGYEEKVSHLLTHEIRREKTIRFTNKRAVKRMWEKGGREIKVQKR
jgi:hypothetical protein